MTQEEGQKLTKRTKQNKQENQGIKSRKNQTTTKNSPLNHLTMFEEEVLLFVFLLLLLF